VACAGTVALRLPTLDAHQHTFYNQRIINKIQACRLCKLLQFKYLPKAGKLNDSEFLQRFQAQAIQNLKFPTLTCRNGGMFSPQLPFTAKNIKTATMHTKFTSAINSTR
jgi:hypothetical protein